MTTPSSRASWPTRWVTSRTTTSGSRSSCSASSSRSASSPTSSCASIFWGGGSRNSNGGPALLDRARRRPRRRDPRAARRGRRAGRRLASARVPRGCDGRADDAAPGGARQRPREARRLRPPGAAHEHDACRTCGSPTRTGRASCSRLFARTRRSPTASRACATTPPASRPFARRRSSADRCAVPAATEMSAVEGGGVTAASAASSSGEVAAVDHLDRRVPATRPVSRSAARCAPSMPAAAHPAHATPTAPAARRAWRSFLRSMRPTSASSIEHAAACSSRRLPLRRRRVDLDAVVEAEHPQGAVALPHHGIERREQRRGLDAARDAGVAVQVRRAASSPRTVTAQHLALVDESLQRGLRVGRLAAGSSRRGRRACRCRAPARAFA